MLDFHSRRTSSACIFVSNIGGTGVKASTIVAAGTCLAFMVGGVVAASATQPSKSAPSPRVDAFDPRIQAKYVNPPYSKEEPRVLQVAVQPDGKVIVAGYFDTVAGQQRLSLVRLNPDGSLDTSFANPRVEASWDGDGRPGTLDGLAVQADGKIIVVGGFNKIGGEDRWCVARLNSDGTLDTTFRQPELDCSFDLPPTVLVQPDGGILVGGSLSNGKGAVIRLEPDGATDSSFVPPDLSRSYIDDVELWKMALQADGRIIIGGQFTRVNGQRQAYVARLNADGTLDSTFTPKVAGYNDPLSWYGDTMVSHILVQANGKVLIGGAFNRVNGKKISTVTRLNADGSTDASFSAQKVRQSICDQALPWWYVEDGCTPGPPLAILPDGGIITYGLQAVTEDGKPYVNLPSEETIVRLRPNGRLDGNFRAPQFDGGYGKITSVAPQSDSAILVGGEFSKVGTFARSGVVRLQLK